MNSKHRARDRLYQSFNFTNPSIVNLFLTTCSICTIFSSVISAILNTWTAYHSNVQTKYIDMRTYNSKSNYRQSLFCLVISLQADCFIVMLPLEQCINFLLFELWQTFHQSQIIGIQISYDCNTIISILRIS